MSVAFSLNMTLDSLFLRESNSYWKKPSYTFVFTKEVVPLSNKIELEFSFLLFSSNTGRPGVEKRNTKVEPTMFDLHIKKNTNKKRLRSKSHRSRRKDVASLIPVNDRFLTGILFYSVFLGVFSLFWKALQLITMVSNSCQCAPTAVAL